MSAGVAIVWCPRLRIYSTHKIPYTFEACHKIVATALALAPRVDHKVQNADSLVVGYLVEAQAAYKQATLLVVQEHGLVDSVEQGLGDDDGRHQVQLGHHQVPELEQLQQSALLASVAEGADPAPAGHNSI